jgi:homoserine dehydrogenase
MKETINLGLIGFGTIGSGVIATLNQNLHLIEGKVQKNIKLKEELIST